MNKYKISNPVRLIAFFLTAVVLTCTFGFTVDGWQIDGGRDDDQIGYFPPAEDSTVDNTPEEPEVYVPPFLNRLTGLETDEDASKRPYFSFITDTALPSYGLSSADLLCEIPTESGERYIAFISDVESLSKIGSIMPERGYISNVVKYFGGISVSIGTDDSMDYPHCDNSANSFDLTKGNYYYTEFSDRFYTNRDLISVGLNNQGLKFNEESQCNLPFIFNDYGSSPIIYGNTITSQLKFSNDGSTTELRYNDSSSKYIIYKNELPKIDSLNGKTLEFTNCFVLFADSVTYDNAEYSQMVMDTIGQGKGYYITQGSLIEINWVGSEDGSLIFYTPDGEQLVANRGRTYISFIKSSKASLIPLG